MTAVIPSPDEIHRQLEFILASEHFAGAERLSRFLRYIVERACSGESAQLKEFVIGADVFDRDHRYDPRMDSVVRVEAGRLRSKLTEYYARSGADDPIIIRVPRGAYAPVFERRPSAAAAPIAATARLRSVTGKAAAWVALSVALLLAVLAAVRSGHELAPTRSMKDLRIVVLPVSTYSKDESTKLLAARVTDGVTREIARLGTVQVVSQISALQAAADKRPLQDIARALRADLIVAANLDQVDDKVQSAAALVDTTADRKFWVSDFAGSVSELSDLERRIATTSLSAIAANADGAYWARGR